MYWVTALWKLFANVAISTCSIKNKLATFQDGSIKFICHLLRF
ncbi:hypothetical protein ApDm4_0119 [Acetobacter pomorum]|nr:hypothetical protein ApDm4_0119 [Acetobacter pomorum]